MHSKEENLPLESSECGCRLCDAADVAVADTAAEEDCERDEATEPEDHGKRLNTEDGELVGNTGHLPWCNDEVVERENSPDGGEDQEVDLAGRVRVPVAGPPVGNCLTKRVSERHQ